MVETIHYKVDDTAPIIYTIAEYNVEKGGDEVRDLTGCIVRFYMKNVESGEYAVNGATCVVSDIEDGAVAYYPSSDETATPGMYTAQFRVEDVNSLINTYPEYAKQWIHIYDGMEE